MNDYKRCRKLSPEQMCQRQREYWRRWKERHAPKTVECLGWTADFKKELKGWGWTAKNQTTGAMLSNGPFESIAKAKMDFLEAVE